MPTPHATTVRLLHCSCAEDEPWSETNIFSCKHGPIRIEDHLPYYCITADVSSTGSRTGTPVGSNLCEVPMTWLCLLRHGFLWRYVRASMSLQGYLPPLCEPQVSEQDLAARVLSDGRLLEQHAGGHNAGDGLAVVVAVDVGVGRAQWDDYGDQLWGAGLAMRCRAMLPCRCIGAGRCRVFRMGQFRPSWHS